MEQSRRSMIGRTLVATLALLLLGALIGASGSSAAQIKYRGKMVEKPPAGAKAREPVSFTVVKVRRNQKTRRKRPGRAKRIKDFSLERPAGTTCVVSNDVSFPFDLLALGFPQIERNGPHRVKRDGTFRFRETGRIPVSDLAGLRDVDGNDFLAWQRGVVGRLRRDGTATGKVRLRFTDPAGTTVCDSYGKRAWVAHEVKR